MNVRETTKCHHPKRVHDFVAKNDEIEFLCWHTVCMCFDWIHLAKDGKRKREQRSYLHLKKTEMKFVCVYIGNESHFLSCTFRFISFVCIRFQLSEKHLTISFFSRDVRRKPSNVFECALRWWQRWKGEGTKIVNRTKLNWKSQNKYNKHQLRQPPTDSIIQSDWLCWIFTLMLLKRMYFFFLYLFI